MKKDIAIIKCSLSFAAILLFASCTDIADVDILGVDNYSYSWQEELHEWLQDSDSLFSNNITFLKSKEANIEDLTLDDFLSSNCLFPAYSKNLQRIYLANRAFLEKDSFLVHISFDRTASYLDSILKQEQTTARELFWHYSPRYGEEQNISTFAIFDKNTNELLYDNILYNTYRCKTFATKRELERGEAGYGENTGIGTQGYEEVKYTIGTHVATAQMSWNITGNYTIWQVPSNNRDTINYSVFVPNMPECNSNFDIPYDFPDREDLTSLIANAYSGNRNFPPFKPYGEFHIGIGYYDFRFNASVGFGQIEYSNYNGAGYAYKDYLW